MKIQRREIKRNASFHGVNFEVDLNLPLEHALANLTRGFTGAKSDGTDEEAAEVSNYSRRRKRNNDQFNIFVINQFNIEIKKDAFFHILHNDLR